MDIAITKLSSKGQVVIPLEMRAGIKEGEKLLIIKSKGNIILKKASKLDKQLEEDLEFTRRTERAWERHDRGEFKRMEFEDFIKEMKKW